MSTPVLSFLQSFHNFSGITIGDRKKQLFLLLRENEGLRQSPTEIELLLKELKPRTYLMEKMFVDILIYFKCEKELLTVFQEGNEKLMKNLWKQIWFFRNLFQNYSVEWIVNELFQQLSFVTRIKFLKNVIYYTEDEQKVDKLFDMVLNKYGPLNAQYVVAGCSLMKMLDIISYGYNVHLSNQHIVFLHKNKKEYLLKLIDMNQEKKLFDFYDEKSKAFKIIAGSDYNFFSKLFKNENYQKAGKKLTRRMLKQELSFIMLKASEIHNRLHRKTVLKRLGPNFEPFFFSTWPSSFSDFHLYTCFSLMKYYPKNKYVEIIQKGLQKLYNTSLTEQPDLISDKLLESTDNIEIRESLLELRIQNSKDEYTLPQFYRIEKSIPILKKKISAADGVKTRENLIIALVKTCAINNDPDSLLEVQEYFNFRHKNDDESIRSSFLSEMKQSFDLSSLSELHWKLIFDFLKWNKVKKQYFWGMGEIYALHLKFLYKQYASLDDITKLLFDDYLTEILKSFSSAWNVLEDVPNFQKYVLEKFVKKRLSSTFKVEEESDLYFQFFKTSLAWNTKYPRDTVNYLECLPIREAIKSRLKERSHSNATYLNNFITRKIPCNDEELLKELEQIFWENLTDKFDVNIIEYYLRKNPLTLMEHFDDFMFCIRKQYLCDSLTMWRLMKHYDHISIVNKIVEDFTSPTKFEIGIGLATLLKPDEYVKLMLTNKTEKMDVDNQEEVENHHSIMQLLGYAKYNDSFSILPTVVQFCEGDSLHEALPPLYYYFQHSPDKYLIDYLQILSNRAVSVRKHAIKLACSVSPVEITYTLIRTMTENEKNQSVLEHMFWKTFKYFMVDKSERFWNLIKIQLQSLDILESNAFKDSCSVRKIPKQFRLRYFDFIWKILDEHEQQGHNVSKFKDLIIESLTPEMFDELPYEFCSNFIKQELLKFGSRSNETVSSFALNCLKFSSQKENILKDICDVIVKFKKNYILHPEFNISRKGRSNINNFVNSLFYHHADFELVILRSFFSNWEKIFSAVDDIKNYIRLFMLIELREVNTVDHYVLKIAEIYMQLVKEFGILGIIDTFKDVVSFLLPDHLFGNDYYVKVYKLALKLSEIDNNDLKLLAIHLLPENYPENSFCVEIQQKIIGILKQSPENSILINLNLYIDSL